MVDWEACAARGEPPRPFGDGPSSAAASTFEPLAAAGGEKADVETLVEGPRAGSHGVSRRSAEGVGAIAWGRSLALLDSLFDDRPALLHRIKSAELPEVRRPKQGLCPVLTCLSAPASVLSVPVPARVGT